MPKDKELDFFAGAVFLRYHLSKGENGLGRAFSRDYWINLVLNFAHYFLILGVIAGK